MSLAARAPPLPPPGARRTSTACRPAHAPLPTERPPLPPAYAPCRAPQAFRHGIPFRPRGLFPPADPLLARLAADPRLRPFEKHMSGLGGPSEALPRGGWATGDAAAAAGLDLRLFFQVG